MKYQVALKRMLVRWVIGIPIAYVLALLGGEGFSDSESLPIMLFMFSGIVWSWGTVGKLLASFKMYIPIAELWFCALILKFLLLALGSIAFYPVLIYTIVRAVLEYKSVAGKENMNFARWIWYAPKEVQCEKPEAARAHADMEEIYSAEHSRYLAR